MKELIISDLYKIMFSTKWDSDPDNWELVKLLANALLKHHGLYFNDRKKIEDSYYWNSGDVEDKFYEICCPGAILSLTGFEHICNEFFDFDLWEQKLRISGAMAGVSNAITKLQKSVDKQPVKTAREITHKIFTGGDDYSKYLEIPKMPAA